MTSAWIQLLEVPCKSKIFDLSCRQAPGPWFCTCSVESIMCTGHSEWVPAGLRSGRQGWALPSRIRIKPQCRRCL